LIFLIINLAAWTGGWEPQANLEETMKFRITVAIAAICFSSAAYAETIKVGVVGPFSGPFALQGKNFKAGIDAWFALHGNKGRQ